MLIDSPRQSKVPLIFVHIPKTGGMSTLNSLLSFDAIVHRNIQEDIKLIKNKKRNPDNYFSFTIIRNPWDRMVSNYFFHKQRFHNDPAHHKKFLKNNQKKKLQEWIDAHNKEDEFWKKYEFKDWLKFFDEKNEEKSTSLYHNTIRATYLDLISINDKIAVDYIVNLHNYKKEINVIKILSGQSFNNPKYINRNKSSHKDYREYYDSKSIEIVANAYKKDIEAFNFKFDEKEYAEHKKYINDEKLRKFISKFGTFKLV